MDILRNPLNGLRYFFNICYYTGAVTYRFKLCPTTNKYIIVQNRWQKAMCVFFAALFSLEIILWYRIFDPYSESLRHDSSSYNPINYFKMAVHMSNTFILIVILATQWSRGPEFLDVINMLHETPSYSSLSIRKPFQVLLLMSLPFILTTIYMITNVADFVTKEKTVYSTFDSMRQETMSLFFLESWTHKTETPFYTILLGTVRFIVLYSFTVFNIFGELLALNCAFCLNQCLDGFSQMLNKKSATSYQVFEEFNNLQNAAHLINQACGLLVFGVTLGLLPYFVFSVVEMTDPNTELPTFVLHLVDSLLVYGFILYAANVNRKAVLLSERFIHEQDLLCLSHYELERLLREITENRIGMSGAGYFTVTCPFLGKLVGLIFTFSVILLQFKSSNAPVVSTFDVSTEHS